ncbi:MAG: LolA family protein [Solirubrobacteraceae bacterium]
MRFLRTVPTRRLLAMIAGLVVVVAGGTAIAIAATANNPVPGRARSLAAAIHRGLSATPVQGINATVSFTNNLISSSDIQSSDPILTGASGRLWVGGGRLRLELQSNNGDAEIVVDHNSFSIYDPSTNTVYRGTMPSAGSGSSSSSGSTSTNGSGEVPTIEQINAELKQLAAHLDITGPTPSDFGSAPAYTVTASPKHDGGLLGDIQLAWDANNGVPLDFAVHASGGATVLELQVTDISFGPVGPSDLNTRAPADATVVKIATPSATSAAANAARGKGKRAAKPARAVTGVSAVSAALPFKLDAPGTLYGFQQQTVQLLDWGSSPAALITYGQGLGAIAVIERAAPATTSSHSSSNTGADHGQSQFTLPTVKLSSGVTAHELTAHELDTALGAAVEFTRGGVSYLVLGSVLPTIAEHAAAAL